MKAKKYGAMACLKNSIHRRNLFYNPRKGLSLDELLEYQNGRCVGKWWEVRRVEVTANTFSLTRTCICQTECYSVAWDLVKDVDHVPGRRAR